jgi:K+-sensing histidine kinase KdpD
MVVTAVTSFIGFNLILGSASRVQKLVSYVRRFQDSGKLERVGDRGDDNIAVLANAIDAGFSAIATRERDREQFMAIAAHELKTPVTTIQGYASFLDSHPLSSDSKRALEIINRQSWRLSRLIEALFLAVRARTGNLRFEPRPLNMSVLVKRVLQEMEPFLSKKTFTSHITDNVSILGDEALLEHALWCLFTCAAALSPESVPVKVTLAKNHRASLSVDIDPSDYPVAAMEELFLPFRSLQYETADGLRSPIGLYLCREIVRVHNGRLFVHDVSALNPEFLMELPI